MKRGLHDYGLELEAVTVPPEGAMVGVTVAEAELGGHGSFFVVQIDRRNGPSLLHPAGDMRFAAGDTVVLVFKGNHVAAGSAFAARKKMPRARSGLHGARN